MANDVYSAEWAAQYSQRAEMAIPGRQGLYRLCCVCLSQVPVDGKILVVGCGTGEELIALANRLPNVGFVGIDPAKPMLEFCAAQIKQHGLAARVTLMQGLLDDLPPQPSFDAATSVLVSQHVLEDSEAVRFFKAIARLLKPGGRIFTADMHIGAGQDRAKMLELWRQNALASGLEANLVDGMLERIGHDPRVRDEALILSFLRDAQFTNIIKPFSSLLYGAWTAVKH